MKPSPRFDRPRNSRRQTLLAVFFFLVAAGTLLAPAAVRQDAARSIRTTVLRPVIALRGGLHKTTVRFSDPVRLRAERDSLTILLQDHIAFREENERLRDLLTLSQRMPTSFVASGATRLGSVDANGSFLLPMGTEHGLEAGDPVVSPSGLVGRLRVVDPKSALGVDWSHPEFRASAMTADGSLFGIVRALQRPGEEPLLLFSGTSTHVVPPVGTVVLTSGHGGMFPRGIPIGVVVERTDSSGHEWYRSHWVRPLAGPKEMAHVLVLTGTLDSATFRDAVQHWGIMRPTLPAVPTTGRTSDTGPDGSATSAASEADSVIADAPEPATDTMRREADSTAAAPPRDSASEDAASTRPARPTGSDSTPRTPARRDSGAVREDSAPARPDSAPARPGRDSTAQPAAAGNTTSS